jgi:hypothetical protein
MMLAFLASMWCFLQFGKRYPKALYAMVPVVAFGLVAAYGVGLIAGCEQPFCVNIAEQ